MKLSLSLHCSVNELNYTFLENLNYECKNQAGSLIMALRAQK